MNFLQNLTIRSKLLLATLVPVAGLLFYLQDSVRKEMNNKQAAQELIRDVSLIEKMGVLIHDLQKERSLQVVYVIQEKNRDVILNQREATDRSIAELHS